MGMRQGRQIGVLLVVVALLAACTAAPAGVRRTQARSTITELARTIGVERHDDIDGFARSAVEIIDSRLGDSVTLVGIHAAKQESAEDPFGVLTFHVQYAAAQMGKTYIDAFDACYEANFNSYGATDYWVFHGEIDPSERRCPDNLAPVTPLVDSSPVSVVAPNAEAAATQVLSELKGEPAIDADAVAQRIEALLEQPSGPYEELARPVVIIGDRGIGVAMGATPKECVLVALIDDEVSRVRPAPILLEPGELGCRAATAIMEPPQLGYAH